MATSPSHSTQAGPKRRPSDTYGPDPCRECGYIHRGRGDLCARCTKAFAGVLESPSVLADGAWVNDHGVQRWQANGLRLVRA